MKEFFTLFLMLLLWSCGPKEVQTIAVEKNENRSYALNIKRITVVNDTFASADYPIREIQIALDSLVSKKTVVSLREKTEALILRIQELEQRSEPLQLTDTGMRSRLKLLRTYLLQFNGALQDQDAVEKAFEAVNEANNALLTYWNNLLN
ncbi:MAG: hypothetical protein O2869_01880 [Bacteroidetes bacterium]|nr:hypothetical protein [Bacteroidota bacterium]MDA0950355.1 hypothetical protein [Bacteroidota bacterium]